MSVTVAPEASAFEMRVGPKPGRKVDVLLRIVSRFLAMSEGKHSSAAERLPVLGRHYDLGNVVRVAALLGDIVNQVVHSHFVRCQAA